MRRKLAQRGWSGEPVENVLADLEEADLLSEQRYVEAYVDERRRKNFGPLRIRAELRERGVENALISRFLGDEVNDWDEGLARAHDRKYGHGAPRDRADLARRVRFLQYRGFTSEQVSRFFQSTSFEPTVSPHD